MAYNITAFEAFDHKRNKVTLDYGEVTFLLYKGECRRFHLKEGGEKSELSEEEYTAILEEILVPRAKKRTLYYMKNADKTRQQIRTKLREGLYPEPVIEKVFSFLDQYSIADDARYAENYIAGLKGQYSRREIEARLRKKGLTGERISGLLTELSEDDEAEEKALDRALRKRYPRGITAEQYQNPAERQKAYMYLARKGYDFASIETAWRSLDPS